MATVEVASAQSALQEEKVEEPTQITEQTTKVEDAPKQAEDEAKAIEASVEKEPQEVEEAKIIPDETTGEDFPKEEAKEVEEVEDVKGKIEELELEKKEGGLVEEGSSKVAPEPEEIEPNKDEEKAEEKDEVENVKEDNEEAGLEDAKVAPAPVDTEDASAPATVHADAV